LILDPKKFPSTPDDPLDPDVPLNPDDPLDPENPLDPDVPPAGPGAQYTYG
jgi:hypothetical protein